MLHFAPHQSGFSLRSLTRLLNRNGFEILKMSEGVDLRVLARKTEKGPARILEANEHSRTSVDKGARTWVRQGFGSRPGKRLMVWWRTFGDRKLRTTYYQGTVLPGGRFISLLDVARRSHQRLPPRLSAPAQRFLPPYVHRKQMSMLEVEASGPPKLPLLIDYERQDPPIWVK